MKRLALVVTVAAAVSIAGCASRRDTAATPGGGETAVNLPPNPPPPVQGTFTGVLRGGMMSIGGEHTGWALEGPGDGRGGGLMVDVSRVRDEARALEGRPVVIRGHVEDRRYVERGTVKVLIAASISPQQE